ncbi:hypothetical protein GCM10028857_24700 [Salinarchaeum chitinilyticum]
MPDSDADRGSSPADRAGPFGFGPGYSPWKDPTVLVLLTISLLAGLMFVGGATIGPALTGDDGDGVFPVMDILSGDGGSDAELTLAANRTELTAGDPVAFTVTNANGSAVRDATVSIGATRRTVDDEGRVVIRVATAGAHTATATAPGANDTWRESNDVGLSVAHRRVQLEIEANRSVATAGEPIALTLVRADSGEPVEGSIAAAVAGEGATVPSQFETVDGATLVLVPDRAGTLYVDGTRATDVDETFETASVALEVERRTVPLNLSVDPSESVAGEAVTATVRRADTGEPIAATLSVDGRSIETGPDGEVAVALESAGDRTIEATVPSTPAVTFTPDSASVSVQRRQVALAASVDRSAITTGGSISVTVTRADTGAPVDATVTVAGDAYATGPDGELETTVATPGEHAIVVTAANSSSTTFEAAELSLSVTNATFELGELDAPNASEPGATVTVSTTATNLGPDDGSDTLVLSLDGERLASEVHALASGEQAPVTFQFSAPAEPGSYEVAVHGSDGTATGTIVVES